VIKLYAWHTPNGRKVSVMLEELALPYEVVKVNLAKGEQFTPEFTAISPNQKIPAIVDGGLALAESGAILIYLAEKTGRLLPAATRYPTLQWLMFQMAQGARAGRDAGFRIGLAFVVPGVILSALSVVQYRRSIAALRPVEVPPGYWVNLAVT